ncbi:MAG: tRNA (adenosine(37)-N6)-threonylcarbamoyltransferase complex ATPase subunit type 1 TsaE [bacterium]
MENNHISPSAATTKKLGQLLGQELCGGEIICLSGDLGAGKTTFTQGLLSGLKIKGPYTSPTFAILKQYNVLSKKYNAKSIIHDVYHIDAYRITSKDLLELGFKDFANKEDSIVIIEWPENVKKIIPTTALWINFEWLSEKERKITLSTKKEQHGNVIPGLTRNPESFTKK